MDLNEYHKRIEKTHTFTGVPSYWEDLQIAIAERNRFQQLAEELYERGMLQLKTTELYKSQAHVQRALYEKSAELIDQLTEEIQQLKEEIQRVQTGNTR